MNECKADLVGRCSFDCVVCRYDDYDNFKKKYDRITNDIDNSIKVSFIESTSDFTKKFISLDANLGNPIKNYI